MIASQGLWRGACLILAILSTATAAAAASPRGGDAKPLAWLRFTEGQAYAGQSYHWLGQSSLVITVDVAPAAGQRLEMLWGSKNDKRTAKVAVHGNQIELSHGGDYDGYRWVSVPLGNPAAGRRPFELQLLPTTGKAAFLAEIRLVGDGANLPQPPSDTPAYRMVGRAVRAGGATEEAFLEMRPFWDRPGKGIAPQSANAADEAAFRAAERNGRLANEQFFRARILVEGWLGHADPKSLLIPRNLRESRDFWNAKDSAADNYPFLVLTCALLDEPAFSGRMLEMLRNETRLTSRIGRLPDTFSFSRQGFLNDKPVLDDVIFGASEYIKDGLLPLTEWLGPSPWFDRMVGIADDVWEHAPVDTPYGRIPTLNVEIGGDLLQAMSRLYWITGDTRYLDYAVRLGDYYLLGDHHPTRNFDSLRLLDHGCEIVSGLSELYAAVSFARPEKKAVYREPIHAMFDRILEVGRDEHGMLYNSINPRAGTHDARICDTWGYNYNGFYTVYLIDGTSAYRQAVRQPLENLRDHLIDYSWNGADSYADSVEGAINLYNREPIASAGEWIDSEIRDMWRGQQPDGVVEGWHGDGNVARTGIMYALWKTQGLTLSPWRSDLRLGAVQGDGESDGRLYISLLADTPWQGVVKFDVPRHKLQMHLPIDYPRINQFPEWFVVTPGEKYEVVDACDGSRAHHTGEQLRAGLPIRLIAQAEKRLIVE